MSLWITLIYECSVLSSLRTVRSYAVRFSLIALVLASRRNSDAVTETESTHAATRSCFSSKSSRQIVTVESSEAVIRSVTVREKAPCGLWGWGRCTKVSTQYRIVYELKTKLSTVVRFECCPGFTGSDCNAVETTECPHGFFGERCSAVCGRCVRGELCNTVTGNCPNGCEEGWTGDRCDRACATGYYGEQCSGVCGRCIRGESCNTVTGNCPNGCEEGWTGDRCDIGSTTPPKRTVSTTTTTASRTITYPRFTTTTRRPSSTSPRPPRTTSTVQTEPTPPIHTTTTKSIAPTKTTKAYSTQSSSPATTQTTLTRTSSFTSKTELVSTQRVTSTTPGFDRCKDSQPIATAVTKEARLQALPADIELYCRLLFPKDYLNRPKSIAWLFDSFPVSKQSGVYETDDWEHLNLTMDAEFVISSLLIVNASSCQSGEYSCRASRGGCHHSASVYLQCPAIPQHVRKNHPVPGCCPVIEMSPVKDRKDYMVLNTAVPVILACILVIVIICLPIVIYRRSARIQIYVNYCCGRYEDTDEKMYDVYISFDPEDVGVLSFVFGRVRPFLVASGFTTFVFPLDSLPGSSKADSIMEAMGQSRRVIIIFSQSYRSCEWCRFEFITARRLFIKQRLKLIPLVYGEDMTDILNDTDFSSVLKSIPFITCYPDNGDSISSKLARKIQMRMPRHAKMLSNSHELQHVNRI